MSGIVELAMTLSIINVAIFSASRMRSYLGVWLRLAPPNNEANRCE